MVEALHFGVQFNAMASDCEVRLACASQADADTLAQAAIDEVRRIEATYSRYRPDTVIGRINANAGRDWVEVDAETDALFDYAATLHATSGGAFDITSGVLRRVWNFRVPQRPPLHKLMPVLDLIGWDKVERAPGRIRLPLVGMELDFGGFGKEYAADRAAALLAAQGVHHGYVNLGGDLHVIGPQPDGTPWQIGIQDPRDAQLLCATIPVQSGGLATSGDYERYFEIDGRRYCHVLDPRTGYPVHYWRSVSVIAPLAIAAGSYATIAMLRQHEGLALLESSGLAYFAIDHEGRSFSRDL